MTGQNKHQLDAERYKNRRQIRREWIQFGLIAAILTLVILIAILTGAI